MMFDIKNRLSMTRARYCPNNKIVHNFEEQTYRYKALMESIIVMSLLEVESLLAMYTVYAQDCV